MRLEDIPKHSPLVHQNGNSGDSLMKALEDFYTGLQEAREKIRECRPNARNYYPFPDASVRLDAARERVGGWERAIDKILLEIEEDLGFIFQQKDEMNPLTGNILAEPDADGEGSEA